MSSLTFSCIKIYKMLSAAFIIGHLRNKHSAWSMNYLSSLTSLSRAYVPWSSDISISWSPGLTTSWLMRIGGCPLWPRRFCPRLARTSLGDLDFLELLIAARTTRCTSGSDWGWLGDLWLFWWTTSHSTISWFDWKDNKNLHNICSNFNSWP